MKINNFWRGLSLLLAVGSCISAPAETIMAVSFKSGGAPLRVTLLDGQKLLCNADEGTFSFKSVAGETVPEPLTLKNINAIRFTGEWSGVEESVADPSLRLLENPVKSVIILEGVTNTDSVGVVYDLAGRTVLRFVWNGDPVDASSLPSGIYILNIENNAIKFVKS